MSTTRLMPLHTGKGRSVGAAIHDIIDYVKNSEKTERGQFVTGYQCSPKLADREFHYAKKLYIQKTGRTRGSDDVIAYHLRQSFVPGEITPEEANRLGRELAMRFTKGRNAFVIQAENRPAPRKREPGGLEPVSAHRHCLPVTPCFFQSPLYRSEHFG